MDSGICQTSTAFPGTAGGSPLRTSWAAVMRILIFINPPRSPVFRASAESLLPQRLWRRTSLKSEG